MAFPRMIVNGPRLPPTISCPYFLSSRFKIIVTTFGSMCDIF
jgi:hypothetical protein